MKHLFVLCCLSVFVLSACGQVPNAYERRGSEPQHVYIFEGKTEHCRYHLYGQAYRIIVGDRFQETAWRYRVEDSNDTSSISLDAPFTDNVIVSSLALRQFDEICAVEVFVERK